MNSLTHKRKLRNLEETLEDLSLLQQQFPKAFPAKGEGKVLPLQENIAEKIEVELRHRGIELSLARVKRALGFWCSRKFYLKAITREQNRIDLEGQAVSPVKESEKQHALSRVESINLQRLLNETPVIQVST